MKYLVTEKGTFKYPDKIDDVSLSKYLEISDFIIKHNVSNIKLFIFDLVEMLTIKEGNMSIEDLTVEEGKPIFTDILNVLNEINNYEIITNPENTIKIDKTNPTILKIEDRNFIFIDDLSKMKMSKYIELEILYSDFLSRNKNYSDLLKGMIGKLFNEIVLENDKIIYLNTDENVIIEYILKASVVEVVKYINFFLSIANGLNKDLKTPSKQMQNM